MLSNTRVFVILTLFAINAALIWAQCNVCSATTQMACVSETQYRACVNNLPAGSVNTCPSGYICSTTTSATCQSCLSGIRASCSSCNTCNANGTFACTGTNTYALCLGTNVPSSSSTGTCGGSLVCNTNLPQICGNPTLGIAATCSPAGNGNNTTTTLPTYAQYYCQMLRVNGRFSVPTDIDNTCKKYIYCFLTTNGTWSGQIYSCAGSTYFDSSSKYCVASRPTGC